MLVVPSEKRTKLTQLEHKFKSIFQKCELSMSYCMIGNPQQIELFEAPTMKISLIENEENHSTATTELLPRFDNIL